MKKLKLPKNPHTGLKSYFHRCKRDNPTCNQCDIHKYKVKIHIKGGENKKRTKILVATNYYDAVKEAINFEDELILNNYYIAAEEEVGNDYSIFDAVIQYKRYLSGEHKFSHKVKKVTVEYQKEWLRYSTYFLDSISTYKDVIDLKWSDMVTTIDNIKFFKIANKKVNRIRKTEKQIKDVTKIPIGDDLMDLLTELGYESKRNSDEYILLTDRNQKVKTIMNDMSKAFTYYRKASGVNNGVSLKSLRKTYITWVNSVMGKIHGSFNWSLRRIGAKRLLY